MSTTMDLSTHLAGATILLVDDNPANLGVLTHALAAHGARILVAQQGESGVQIAQRAQPDLILLDVRLPGMDGFEVCRRLKASDRTAAIPVLFITVQNEATDKLAGFAAGGVDYIIKPFEEAEVLARVTTHLRLRQLNLRLQAQNEQLLAAEAALRAANEDLEQRVQERTSALAAEHNLLRTVINNVPDGIYVKDRQSQFVLANTAMIQFLNLSTLEDLVGQTDFAFFPPEQAAQFYDDEQAVMQSGQALVNKEEINTPAHTDAQRWMLTTKVPLRDAHGQISGLVGISRDITARKHLEAQFLQAQKMEGIGRLAGGVAHDFNNLLTAITGYADLARDDLAPTDPLRGDLQAILDAASRATALIRQLLIFARKQVLDPQVVNINDLVLNLDKLLRRLIGEDIELVTVPAAEPWQIKADATQIEQVLVNLVINARDAMPHGGKLTIETANVELDETYTSQHMDVVPGPYVMLAVSDTGVGMPPEVQARIFEPFFTTKEVGKGSGLGLATCYGIVKQHGGHIWLYSEVDYGTTFRIYLPRAMEAADTQTVCETPKALLGGNEIVLLVEDEVTVRQLAARVLRNMGYVVLEATNGIDALQVAGGYPKPIDLLLTDIVMPQMGGIALVERLRDVQPHIRVLFMSGYTDQTIVHRGMLGPEAPFLQKPFSPDLLARRVREVLAMPEERSV